jgi:hypothetical protein
MIHQVERFKRGLPTSDIQPDEKDTEIMRLKLKVKKQQNTIKDLRYLEI